MNEFIQYTTLKARLENEVAFLQIYRPEANNTINETLIEECGHALEHCAQYAKIVLLEGLPHVFCFGADFKALAQNQGDQNDPKKLYQVWQRLNQGPFVSIAKVQGQANAGGMGFIAACDIVLAEKGALFSLSELLFSLMPACVLPFLIQKIGWHKAHYLTLTTQPITASRAQEIGLVDEVFEDVDELVRKHLLRLKRLQKKGISRYKRYMSELSGLVDRSKDKAVKANLEVFGDKDIQKDIIRFVTTGTYPWEDES